MTREKELELRKVFDEILAGDLDWELTLDKLMSAAKIWHISEEIKGLEGLFKKRFPFHDYDIEKKEWVTKQAIELSIIQSKIAELEKLRGGK